MKKVKILELTVSNFKGQTFHDKYGENENHISGRNACGKSTRIAAWMWLLSGYCDSNTPQNSNLFNDKEEISPETPTAIVKALVAIDGETYTIERRATAAFTRKRGSDEMVKNASDKYEYFIDNIARTSTDFKAWLSEMIAPEDMLRFVLDGNFFIGEVFEDKRKARQLIEKVVGSVSREEMKGEYDIIDELIGRYTLDQIEMQATEMCKNINQRLSEIPVAIESKQNEIDIIAQTDFNAIQHDIDLLENEEKDLNAQIFDISARLKPQLEAKSKAEQGKRMATEIFEKAKSGYQQQFIDADNKLVAEIGRMDAENEKTRQRKTKLESDNNLLQSQLTALNGTIEQLRKERETIKNTAFECETVCPTCGAPISEEKINEAKAKFEQKQKQDLEGVVVRGKAVRAEIDRINAEIEKNAKEMLTLTMLDVEPVRQKLNDLRMMDITPFEETEQGVMLQKDINAIVIPSVEIPDDTALKNRIDEIKVALKSLYMQKGTETRLKSLEKEIEGLHLEQREKGAELARYERQRKQVHDYKQEQIEILSHKVNDGLKFSRLDVWSKQKSGEIVPDLVIKDAQGVSFSTTNNASRLITVVDIQRFFCDKLGVNLPTFLDESSVFSTGNLPSIEGTQMFYLFCADTSLKIESK